MKKSKSPIDSLPCLLLATFLLISSTNYFCSVKDNFISKNMKVASAETSINLKDNISLPVSAKLIHPTNETNFTLPISRNPFRLSSKINLDVTNSKNISDNLSKGNNYVATSSYPILNGTVISEQKSSIIALYNGKSNYYELGDNIGPYELKSIKTNSIVVSKDGKATTILIGENTPINSGIKQQSHPFSEQKSVLPSIDKAATNSAYN